ncbi:MAG: hypothetical protein IPP29_25115 [Bacteroidetes bacterium]|nr:hypothetical protein [Bacteroidota bacterium]
MLTDHPLDCLTCEVNGNCELQTVAARVVCAMCVILRVKPPGQEERFKSSVRLPIFRSASIVSAVCVHAMKCRGNLC